MSSASRPTPAGFPRSARLTASADFQRVFSGAERVADRYFTLLIRPNALAGARLGLAISRRKAPRAVDRNRLKRIARDTFRRHRHCIGGCDIVLIGKPVARHASRAELNRSLERLWQRVASACPGH